MVIKNLGGHSGCSILLCEDEENNFFVRKIARDENYNHRLIIQEKKQSDFKGKTLKTPKVLNKGYTKEGLFYFDMEYIQGITLTKYMNTIEVGRIHNIVKSIIDEIVCPDNSECEVDEDVFIEKIKALSNVLSKENNSVINRAIELLLMHSWKPFEKSFCHGDLTLENIIVKDSELYLIDFLDSFYNSYLVDIGSLMQDVQALWSYRYEKIDINTIIRLQIFRDILIDEMKALHNNCEIEIYYALLLKLIRIYPYAKDSQTYEYLNEKIMMTIYFIEKMEKLI